MIKPMVAIVALQLEDTLLGYPLASLVWYQQERNNSSLVLENEGPLDEVDGDVAKVCVTLNG